LLIRWNPSQVQTALSKRINRIRLLEKSPICAGLFCKRDVIIMQKDAFPSYRLYPSQIQTAFTRSINTRNHYFQCCNVLKYYRAIFFLILAYENQAFRKESYLGRFLLQKKRDPRLFSWYVVYENTAFGVANWEGILGKSPTAVRGILRLHPGLANCYHQDFWCNFSPTKPCWTGKIRDGDVQCVAVCCGVLQCVAVRCSMVQYVAVSFGFKRVMNKEEEWIGPKLSGSRICLPTSSSARGLWLFLVQKRRDYYMRTLCRK